MFSILIPSYNNITELLKCLFSLEKLNPKVNFKCIVCIDGSTDDSYNQINSFNFSYPLEIILHQSNKGRAAARNTLLKNCTSRYVLFLDSDTEVHPDLLVEHLSFLKKSTDIISIGHIHFPSSDTWGTYFEKRGKGKFKHATYLDIKYLNTGNIAFTSSSILPNFNETISYGEDLIWGFDLIKQNPSSRLKNNCKAIANSISEKNISKALEQYYEVGKTLIPYVKCNYPNHFNVFSIDKFLKKPIVWVFKKWIFKSIYFSYPFIPFPLKSGLINYLVMYSIVKGYLSVKENSKLNK